MTTKTLPVPCPCLAPLMLGKPPACGPTCWHVGAAGDDCLLCHKTGYVGETVATARGRTRERQAKWYRKRQVTPQEEPAE